MLSGIRCCVGLGVEGWFDDNVRRVVGGGRSTYFWLDNWVGGAPLKVQFPHLFYLTQDKETSVSEMEERGWAVGGWCLGVEEASLGLGGGGRHGMCDFAI